jgi:hypothetical protein
MNKFQYKLFLRNTKNSEKKLCEFIYFKNNYYTINKKKLFELLKILKIY